MSAALVLVADGRRENGRWKRGSVDIGSSANIGWHHRIKECGVILDHRPDLAAQVVSGDLTLNAAHEEAQAARAEVALREQEERQAAEAGRYDKLRKSGRGAMQYPVQPDQCMARHGAAWLGVNPNHIRFRKEEPMRKSERQVRLDELVEGTLGDQVRADLSELMCRDQECLDCCIEQAEVGESMPLALGDEGWFEHNGVWYPVETVFGKAPSGEWLPC